MACRVARPVLVLPVVLILAFASRYAQGACASPSPGFAIEQCAARGFFSEAPYVFTVTQAVFWQLGFGNALLNSGAGSSGTGLSPAGVFDGNDSGLLPAVLMDARGFFQDPAVPPGSLCLGANSWAAQGVDGCCDNVRDPFAPPLTDDDFLNPYFDVNYAVSYSSPGLYSLTWQQDYPMAVLLTEATGSFFAFAAVATASRGNDGSGSNGPCYAADPGPNPAPCDRAPGFFDFAEVRDGAPNPLRAGNSNVIPWQAVPRPIVSATTSVDPNDPSSDLLVDLSWPAARVYSDLSTRPSTNPTLGPAASGAAPGVGVLDVQDISPLVRYVIEAAAETDPSFSAVLASRETDSISLSGLQIPVGSCLRVRTLFGVRPRTTAPSIADCRLGRCGDVGYEVVSGRVCTGPCVPSGAEVCDGEDNDCDGATDEGLENLGTCSTGAPGICDAGTLSCVGGAPACRATTASAPEVCDGADNDCDGLVDESDPQEGTLCGYVCGLYPMHLYCILGELLCLPDNATPIDDWCNGLDDNCNGIIDEDGYPMGPCSTGLLSGCAAGSLLCRNGSYQCVPNNPPTTEVCDGYDNDCDGFTDEGNPPPPAGVTCNTGQRGVCATGTASCATGSAICTSITPPSAEICDGLDNDCDGIVDGFAGASCGPGQICGWIDVRDFCVNGEFICLPVTSPASDDLTCDGRDDDCDGSVDEDVPTLGSCSTGLKGACKKGRVECVSGSYACVPLHRNCR